jgi:Cd2+/Zn2+-exporting ATPase
MIGRLARSDTWADVGIFKVLRVTTAGTLIASAVIVQRVASLPEQVVLALAAGSLCLTAFPIVVGTLRGLARLQTNVDELLSIAIVASLVLGEWVAAAFVSWIMVLGALLEEYTSQRARRHIEALVKSGPREALRINDDGTIVSVAVTDLLPGQSILIRPGDVVAADGRISDGESQLDESMMTGEGVPVTKAAGDRVLAGTINGNGSLKVVVERVGAESTHGRIIQLVQQAEQHRAPILRVAEAYAKWFTPTVLALAAVVWLATGEPRRAVTVLIVGCPCAFVLATPTAIMAALGRASREGILIKGGKYVEACAQVDVLAFDKTGTLTSGNCRIRDVVPLDGGTAEALLAQAARLEAGAEHPLARAIVERAKECGVEIASMASIKREAGLGISELVAERDGAWHIGSQQFMDRRGVLVPDDIQRRAAAARSVGQTAIFLAEGRTLRGLLTVEDEIRPEARGVFASLRAAGYSDLRMLTGDVQAAASHMGQQLSMPPQQVLAELLPEQKYQCIESWEQGGRRVCYVGDGTNDGPALAVASVGVSIGSRENTVALENAQVVLMRAGLAGLPVLLSLSKATTRTINQNIILFGLLFNAAMLGLSSLGLLSPIFGAIGHNLGSVAVVLNSARLLRYQVGCQRD